MIIRIDKNNRPINETAKRSPLQASGTASLAASTSGSATITIPANEIWFIKSWTVTKGTNVTVSSITVDGNNTYKIASVTDTVTLYGAVINSDTSITISGSNAGTTSESIEIKVEGYKITGII